MGTQLSTFLQTSSRGQTDTQIQKCVPGHTLHCAFSHETPGAVPEKIRILARPKSVIIKKVLFPPRQRGVPPFSARKTHTTAQATHTHTPECSHARRERVGISRVSRWISGLSRAAKGQSERASCGVHQNFCNCFSVSSRCCSCSFSFLDDPHSTHARPQSTTRPEREGSTRSR